MALQIFGGGGGGAASAGSQPGRIPLVYSGGTYPTRSGPAGALYEYIGPTQPTTWATNDTWIQR